MNWEQMKKNKGARVQVQPTACRMDKHGNALPAIDDEWLIQDVSDAGVQISNPRTGHQTILGKDHIYKYTSNPDRSQGGIKHGFLSLTVQIFLQGNNLSIRPTLRPGEPLKSTHQAPDGSNALAQGADEYEMDFDVDLQDDSGTPVWETVYWVGATWDEILLQSPRT